MARQLVAAMSRCRSCGAPIRWAMTEHGRRIPLDAASVGDGRFGTGLFVLRDGGELAMAVPPGVFPEQPHYVTHFATCPNASEHRRSR
jgi:hypothetical protein